MNRGVEGAAVVAFRCLFLFLPIFSPFSPHRPWCWPTYLPTYHPYTTSIPCMHHILRCPVGGSFPEDELADKRHNGLRLVG